jgi:hypothetical protein
MPNDSPPECPKCGSNDRVYEACPCDWWCNFCKIGFDDDPDEGGAYSDNPVRSAERNEEHETRQAAYAKRHGRQPRLHRRRRMER